MWRSIKKLKSELKVDRFSTNWRAGPRYYRSSPDDLLKPGVANMSPAWFEQGHNICKKKMRQGSD